MKSKFRLLPYFSAASLILLVIIAFLLSLTFRWVTVNTLSDHGEAENTIVAHSIAITGWPIIASLLDGKPSEQSAANIKLRKQMQSLNRKIMLQHHKMEMIKIKVYDLSGMTIYSTSQEQIGEDQSTNTGVQAALSGTIRSSITHRDSFNAYDRVIENRDLLQSYVPIFHPKTDQIAGVFEIYSDFTPMLEHISHTQWKVVFTVIAILLLAYAVLFGIVHHANDILNRQGDELEGSLADLEEAKNRAENLAQEKSEFLANVSHEIRTPLNGVLGMIEVLETTNLGQEQREQVEIAMKAGNSLSRLIDDVLNFSKIESGSLELEKIPFDIWENTEESVQIFSNQAWSKNIYLACNIAAEVPQHAIGDPMRLQQVLMNLLGNALKFTDQGGISLEVSIESETDRELQIRFTVRDTGIGIDKNNRSQIFDSYQQADGSITRRFGGTGLGLAIVHRLVEMMDGTIDVENNPEGGSIFWCCVPLAKVPFSVNPHPDQLRGKRALVVEKVAASRKGICSLLQSLGVKPTALESCHDVDLQRLADWDIVICDIDSTDEQTREDALKNCEALNIPVIATVAAPRLLLTIDRNIRDGEKVLAKPVRRISLSRALLRAFDSSIEAEALPNRRLTEKHRNQRLLLVEDNVVNQKVALTMLKRLGCQVELATNGEEALTAFKSRPYDLIFMDCQMPTMDGYTATREIRKLESNSARKIPIVAMTAHTMKGDQEKCIDAGMDGYLSKPIRLERLEEIIDTYAAQSN